MIVPENLPAPTAAACRMIWSSVTTAVSAVKFEREVTIPVNIGLGTTARVTVSVAPAVEVRLLPAAIVIVSPLAIACGVPELPARVKPVDD